MVKTCHSRPTDLTNCQKENERNKTPNQPTCCCLSQSSKGIAYKWVVLARVALESFLFA